MNTENNRKTIGAIFAPTGKMATLIFPAQNKIGAYMHQFKDNRYYPEFRITVRQDKGFVGVVEYDDEARIFFGRSN